MLKRFGPVSLLLIFILTGFSSPGFTEDNEIRIKLIEVAGNRKIDTAMILSKISLKEGDLFSPEQIREDIKTLYRMGYFDRVEVESEGFEGGVALTFRVHEKPFLVDVVYEGNENIDKDKLKEKVPVKTDTFLDMEEISSYVDKIKKVYEADAYYSAEVTPVIQLISEDQAVLTFLIKEGERAYVRRVRMAGNKAFTDKELKKQIETSKYFWLTSWLTESGRYKEETVQADLDRLREHYLNHGYLEVQVAAPKVELSEDKEWFDITIPIVEGDQFRIRDIRYEGNELFETGRLVNLTKSKEGEIFNRGQIRQDIMSMVDLYGERGYIFANVVPQLSPNIEDKTVDVSFQVTEDDPVKVREIHITGNDKTRDKVIRREIRVNEQELINTRLLRRSFQRLNNLNFFENIEIVPEQVEPGWVDLEVKVQEKPTGTFSIGGGYSSVDRFIAMTEVTQGNLFGRGQLLRAKAELGGRRTTYSLTFREPYLFDSNISGTTDLFNSVRDFSSYQEKRVGGDIVLGRSFGEYVNGSVSYTLETLNIFDLRRVPEVDAAGNPTGGTVPDRDIPEQVVRQAELGKTLTSALGFSLSRDTRDFIFDPTSGSRNSISLEYAGTFLGGDNDYYKVIFDSSRFFPLWREHVLSVHGRVGYAVGIGDKELPVGERFYVGGINTVRGFKFGKAGPITSTGEIIGGNKELYINVEYLIPLVPEAKIKWLFFYDIGRAFDDSEAIRFSELRQGAGFGIRWISPVGPLRLEMGANLDPERGEETGFIPEFSIGTLF
ncbi:outer membrane protein assembly factor BamA [Candidatus Manganitrophus noduliformans]|uniref:Outer membrane protein assembly factor BamA n=1 Tax=Candidatus Manganitrophus noduliformans TaxID=2606439 RepID=A0A7X6DPJ0_9BACT|nr:outer membrane protein assembly factor BamA [Candidatus Manganitrophus noduliformans]NKE70996.1 outer membrane protein assembly factor BamA [Candidatus Manganitrophus noduliformans]